MHDWSLVESIWLNSCQIDDEGWKVFVDNAGSFSNLKTIRISIFLLMHIKTRSALSIRETSKNSFLSVTLSLPKTVLFLFSQKQKILCLSKARQSSNSSKRKILT
jgi:hypothetical protein